MTYEEFRKIVEDTGKYYVTEDEQSVFVTKTNHSHWSIRISKNVEAFIEFNFASYGKNDGDLIRAALELAETPLDEREPEKRYCLRHKFIVPMFGGFRAYLVSDDGLYNLSSPTTFNKRKKTFTKKEIEDIKNEFGVTLEDFELLEVKDEKIKS